MRVPRARIGGREALADSLGEREGLGVSLEVIERVWRALSRREGGAAGSPSS
jgi:hypothetical protein